MGFSRSTSSASPSTLRYLLDHRQAAGMLLAYGLLVTVTGCTDVVLAAGASTIAGLGIAQLVTGVVTVCYGSMAAMSGLMALTTDEICPKASTATMMAAFTAWFAFLTVLAGVGMGIMSAPEAHAFVPPSLNPDATDVRLVGSMAFLPVLAYAGTVVGALTFFAIALRAFDTAAAASYNGSYYRQRMAYYACLTALAGLAEFILGAYLIARKGSGPYAEPVGAGLFTVIYPEIAIAVGLMLLLLGVYALARSLGIHRSDKGYHFQALAAIGGVATLALQVLVQVGSVPGAALAAQAPTFACFVIGLAMMPAYLDAKMRLAPEAIGDLYYSHPTDMSQQTPVSINVQI